MIQSSFSISNLENLEDFRLNHSHDSPEILLCAFHASFDSDNFAAAVTAEESFRACKIMKQWENAMETLALLLGVPGNIMAAVTALSMDHSTTSNYIFFLSVGDLFTLLARAATPYTANASFQVMKATAGFFPNSMLVLIVFERFMAVRYPWKKKRWYTVRAGLWSIAVTLIVYIAALIFWTQVESQMESAEIHFALSMMLFLFSCPFIIVINVLTMKQLRHLQGEGGMNLQFWSQVESSITYIMVLASLTFVFLNGPFFIGAMVWFTFKRAWTGDQLIKNTNLAFLLNFAYWMTYLHHALNFYIYVLGTKRYRIQCILILKSWMPDSMHHLLTSSLSQSMMSALSSLQSSKSTLAQRIGSGMELSLSKLQGCDASSRT